MKAAHNSAIPERAPQPDVIDAFARFALSELRITTGLDDEQILHSSYLKPNTADARFDTNQRIQHGYVPAPALAIKARMKELLAN